MRSARRLAVLLMVTLLCALGAQAPGTAAQASTPAAWKTAADEATKLSAFGRTAEAIGVLETFLARYPNVAEAHHELAMARLTLGTALPEDAANRAERVRHFERAATGFRRSLDLTRDPAPRFERAEMLILVYGADMLNAPRTPLPWLERWWRRTPPSSSPTSSSRMCSRGPRQPSSPRLGAGEVR